MIRFRSFISEALRNKPDKPLMQRAIQNMPKDREVDAEFAKDTAKKRKSINRNFSAHHPLFAIYARRHSSREDSEKAMDRVTTHKMGRPMTFFRGLSKEDPLHHHLSSASPGDSVDVGGHGTSYARSVAKGWGPKAGGSTIVYHAKPGTRAVHVTGMTHDPHDPDAGKNEREVYLARTKGRYLGSETIGGITHHHVEVGD